MDSDSLSKDAIIDTLSSFNDALQADFKPWSTLSVTTLREKIDKIASDSQSIVSEKAVRPWNYTDFQLRLYSFKKTSHWFAKPYHLSAWQCARFGWQNTAVDTISCSSCGASVFCMNAEMPEDILVSGHDSSCGWRDEPCSDRFCQLPVDSPLSIRQDFKSKLPVMLRTLFLAFKASLSSAASEIIGGCIMIPIERNSDGADSLHILRSLGLAPDVISDDHVSLSVKSNQVDLKFLSELDREVNDLANDGARSVWKDFDSCISKAVAADSIGVALNAAYDALGSWYYRHPSGLAATVIETSAKNLSLDEKLFLRNIFGAAVLLTICGWATPRESNTSAATTSLRVSTDCSSTSLTLCCGLCARAVDAKSIFSRVSLDGQIASGFNSLRQHRLYCPWIHPAVPTSSLISGSAVISNPGWKIVADALVSDLQLGGNQALSNTTVVSDKIDSWKCWHSGQGKRDHDTHDGNEDSPLDPRLAYKRIKRVLDLSVAGEGLFQSVILPK